MELSIQERLKDLRVERGLIQADQNIHQRGLTRAVFAQQRQHLAPVHGQADILIGIEAAKPLADMFHSQQLAQMLFLRLLPF